MENKISIILPAFNAESYIKTAINSVLNQTYKNFEFIIIDDGSTDNTFNKIKEIKDPRIILIKNENNIGLQKTLNKGLKIASGEFIARIDADDKWVNSDKLEKQINFLIKNKNYGLIGTGVIVINENNKEIFRYLNPLNDKDIRNNILSRCPFIHSSVMFIKNAALECGGYSISTFDKHVEDYKLWLEIGKKYKFYNLNSYDTIYRISNTQISSKNNKEQIKKSLSLTKQYKNYYPNYFKAIFRGYIRLFFYGYLNLFFLRAITAKIKIRLNK